MIVVMAITFIYHVKKVHNGSRAPPLVSNEKWLWNPGLFGRVEILSMIMEVSLLVTN
jgi:hypothetical protein